MIKTFDEFVLDMENQEAIEEGKLANILMAVSIASTSMFGNYMFDKHYKSPAQNSSTETKVEQVEKTEKTDSIATADTMKIKNIEKFSGEDYYPSDDILEFIKNTEGWHEGWKDDGVGNPTTGWGFKITKELKKKFPKGMTKHQADRYFKDVAIPERVVVFKKSVPSIHKYTRRQLDALFDLFYNVGRGTFTKGSPSLQRALKNGDMKQIVKEMNHDYDNPRLPGIKIRRDFERELFMQDV